MVNTDYGTNQAILTKTLTRGMSADDKESIEGDFVCINDGRKVRKEDIINSVTRKSKRNGGLTVKSHSYETRSLGGTNR